MKDVKGLVLDRVETFETTTPAETVQKICTWVNEQPEVFSSMGVAAFGPLCLDKSMATYGSVTSTPKLAW